MTCFVEDHTNGNEDSSKSLVYNVWNSCRSGRGTEDCQRYSETGVGSCYICRLTMQIVICTIDIL